MIVQRNSDEFIKNYKNHTRVMCVWLLKVFICQIAIRNNENCVKVCEFEEHDFELYTKIKLFDDDNIEKLFAFYHELRRNDENLMLIKIKIIDFIFDKHEQIKHIVEYKLEFFEIQARDYQMLIVNVIKNSNFVAFISIYYFRRKSYLIDDQICFENQIRLSWILHSFATFSFELIFFIISRSRIEETLIQIKRYLKKIETRW